MLEFIDAISSWWHRQLMLVRDPEARARLTRDFNLVFPLAVRQLKRSRGRSVLMALVICLTVGLYLMASAAMRASIEGQGAQAEPLWVPAEIVLYGPNIIADNQLRSDLSGRLGMRYSDVAVIHEVYSAQGAVMAVGTSFPPALFNHLGIEVELRDQLIAQPQTVGLFPRSWGCEPGETVWLGWMGEDGWQEADVAVRGLYEDSPGGWNAPLVARAAFTQAGVEPNGWLGFDRNPRLVERSVSGRLSVEDHLITRVAPETLLKLMSNRAMGPVRMLMAMGVMLAVLGVFNLLLLAFLRRKRQLGTLKALGMESGQLGLLLISEGAIVSGAGLLSGWFLGTASVLWAGRQWDIALELTFGTYVAAALIAVLVFALASWVPVRLCRLATVDQLLHARRVYINPNPSCTNCGRCGGF